VVSFPQVFPPKTCIYLFPPKRATWLTHLILLDLINRKLMGLGVEINKHFNM
jgi:hypothetical protein